MMDANRIRDFAETSVRRGCGFGLIEIVTTMVGFSGDPYLAVRCGAILTTLAAVILYWRGQNAPRRNYRDTEVWLMMRQAPVPAVSKDRLQQLIGNALAETYAHYARIAAISALVMWGVLFGMRLLRLAV